MPPYESRPEDLALHGARVLGFATARRIAARFELDEELVDELLLDFEAYGWVRSSSFAGDSGWSLTEAGRTENERRLAVELDAADAREAAVAAHAAFLPLNRRFGRACTKWQLRPTSNDPMAFNDHTDWGHDEQVLRTFAAVEKELRGVGDGLAGVLARFEGYADRYSRALRKVEGGSRRWVDSPELDSCHSVWIQLHEDLLATLGIPRGSDG